MKKLQRAYAVVADNRPPSAPTLNDRLTHAFALHQAGDLQAAVAGYQEVLAEQPTHSDALHLLGVAAHQLGDPHSAVQLIEGSLSVNIANPDAASNLGNARLACGDAEGAEFAYRQALRLNSQHADAQYNLANLLQRLERYEEALAAFDAAAMLLPSTASIYFNRANLLQAMERWEEAISDYDRVQALDSQFPSLHTNRGAAYANAERWEDALDAFRAAMAQAPADVNGLHNLGCVLNKLGREKEAVEPLEAAFEIQPDNLDTRRQLVRALLKKDQPRALEIAEAAVFMPEPTSEDWYLLGVARQTQGKRQRAIEAFQQSLALDPDFVYGSHHLASAFAEDGRLDDAITAYEAILERNSKSGDIYVNLGLAMKDRGEVTEAIATMRQGIALTDDPESHSNMIFTLCYSNELTSQQIYDDSVAWAERHTPVVPPAPPVRPLEGRKIRIGYLSADYHHHPAGYLYRALFPLHDREKFEVIVYANQTVGDEVSKEIFDATDRWHMVKHMSDQELADLVREDEIDIFMDLLGHTNNHRLTAFGLRPAPVQATWIGYFGTTGMRQMDYIVCDRYAVPEAEERYYSERPARMPGCMYVFQPPKIDVPVSDLPMAKNGYPTFGCFNNTAKITEEVVALWCEVLREVPDARMILNRWPFQTESVRERYYAMFAAYGVDRSRVDIVATKGREAYFRSYHDVDVMLDTFPFGGGTTTSEALWMGVPVVSLPADRLVGHMTETIVRAVGRPEILVEDREGFVAMAKGLVADADHLAEMRTSLRAQVENSALCDLPTFARELESLYAWMLEDARKRA